MTDVLPFLPKSATRDIVPSLDDEIQRCMGSFGWAQLLQAALVSLAWFFDAQHTFITVFAEAVPAWHSTRPDRAHSHTQCQLPRAAWDWDRPSETTIVSDWDLACAGTFISGLPASSFFTGCLAGGFILATLADSSLGRKKMLVISCLVMSLAGLATAFAPNIWVYSALRFVTGFGRGAIGTCALVLSSEAVGKRWRGEVGVLGFFCFAFGFLSLPAVAYLDKDSSWRRLYVWISIPAILYSILVHFVLRESPRWLFVQGRREEAIEVLKHMSNTRATPVDVVSMNKMTQSTQIVDLYSGIKILSERRWAFRRLSLVMIIGFGAGMVYYGMPLGVGSLSVNLYLSVALNALLELPASLITVFLIAKLNRRSAVLTFSTLSGVCSVSCTFAANKNLQMGLELISYFSACTALNLLQIYTLELFPTCVRNSALSMLRQAMVLGAVFSPMLVAAGRNNSFLSYGVFGLIIGCCGIFVVCLPETRGGTYCDTMDEQECSELKASVATINAGV